MKIQRHTITISSEEKVLFPESGITKQELVEYYRDVADYMIPHTRNRPLTMHRFPNGIDGEDFYQKERPDYFPKWIDSRTVKKEDGTIDMVLVNNAATLVYLANQVAVPHIWLSRVDKPNSPDRVIFDLDPSTNSFRSVVKAAQEVRTFLNEACGLSSFAMLTGSEGIHVVVPLRREEKFEKVHHFAKKISQLLAEDKPDQFTTKVRKKDRGDALFLDYLRNSYAQTGVAPYAVRALENAPVATPVEWDELDDIKSSGSFTIRTVLDRLRDRGDPWKGIGRHAQSLHKALQSLNLQSDG